MTHLEIHLGRTRSLFGLSATMASRTDELFVPVIIKIIMITGKGFFCLAQSQCEEIRCDEKQLIVAIVASGKDRY